MQPFEIGLVVERIDLTESPAEKDVDRALRPRREMWRWIVGLARDSAGDELVVAGQEREEGGAAEAAGGPVEEIAPRERGLSTQYAGLSTQFRSRHTVNSF